MDDNSISSDSWNYNDSYFKQNALNKMNNISIPFNSCDAYNSCC